MERGNSRKITPCNCGGFSFPGCLTLRLMPQTPNLCTDPAILVSSWGDFAAVWLKTVGACRFDRLFQLGTLAIKRPTEEGLDVEHKQSLESTQDPIIPKSCRKPLRQRFYNPEAPLYQSAFDPSDTAGIKEHFEEQGFVKIRALFSKQEVLTISDNLNRYQKEVAPAIPDRRDAFELPMMPGKYANLGRINHYDPFFQDLMDDKRLMTIAAHLLDGPMRTRHMQFFNIIPGVSPATPPHQDAINLGLLSGAALNCWIPLAPVNAENGCLHYIPGSHKWGRLEHKPLFGDSGPITLVNYGDVRQAKEIAIHAGAGDVLIHHALTIHLSEDNRTSLQRYALGVPVTRSDEKPVSNEEWLVGANP